MLKKHRGLGVIVFLVGLAVIASAQTYQGRISGTITDKTGAVVSGATVVIKNTGTDVTRTLTTSSSGEYVAPNLDPGPYLVTASAPGFKRVERTGVRLEVAKDLRIDVQLEPGGATETVTVTEEAPLVDTTNDVLGGSFSNQSINELPLQGRDFQNLLTLRPGVQRIPGGGFLSISSNGNRPEDNNFLVDGTDDNDVYYGTTVINAEGVQGTPATHLPIDAIQEFNTMENQTAEYGWKPGAVVNVGIKSGTNQFHGTAYEFVRNSAFDARNYFNPYPQPASELNLNQYGGSIGGPIIRNKLFFFANYEGAKHKVGNPGNVFSPVTVANGDPTTSLVDAFAECNATGSCNSLSQNVAKYYPTNFGVTDPNDPTAVNLNLNNTNSENNFITKVDYHPNQNHTISGRYFYGESDQVEEDVNVLQPYFLSAAKTRVNVGGASWTWTPNSKWVNNLRFAYNSFWQQLDPVDAGKDPKTTYGINTGVTDPVNFGFPEIRVSGFSRLGGNGAWPLFTTPNQTYQVSDNASVALGRHNVRFGGEYRYGSTENLRNRYGRGRVDFTSRNGLSALENFVYGNPRRGQLFIGDSKRSIHMTAFGGYVQDDWRATARLTISAGLRYDIALPIKEANNLLGNFDLQQGVVQVGKQISSPYNIDGNNFAPHLSLAYDMFGDGKTVLRAGYGMTYEVPHISVFIGQNGVTNASTTGLNTIPTGAAGINTGNMLSVVKSLSASEINWTSAGPLFDTGLSSISCSYDSACALLGVNRNLVSPYIQTFNVNIEHAFGNTTSLQIAYVWNKGTKLYSINDINQNIPALDTEGDQQSGRPFVNKYPYLSYINFLQNLDSSVYNGLQVTLTQRAYKGLNFIAGYTWSHAIDTASSNRAAQPQNSYDNSADRGNSDLDLRHRFTFAMTYNLPGKKGFAQLLEGWQINNIVTIQSGYSIGFYDDTNDISATGEFNDRWNFYGNASDLKWSPWVPIPFYQDGTTNPQCAAHASAAQLQTYGCYQQGSAVIVPMEPGTFGNMRRNNWRGPAYANWDFSVTKSFQLGEHVNLQLRGEFFNIMNHPNFSNIDLNLADTSTLGIAQFTPDVGASNPVVGSGGSRHIQIGAKIIF